MMERITGAVPARVPPRLMPALDGAGLLLGLVLATAIYARQHAAHPWRPAAARLDQGWWAWWDQGRYLDAALAWAAGDFDPARHFYLPGYPLLAAPFVHLTPAQPFWLPDLACLLAAMALFALLAARLASGIPVPRTLAGLLFLGTTLLTPQGPDAWVIPWTTTPTAPLMLGCLLAALRFADRPAPLPAFLAAAGGGGMAAFRPMDAVVGLTASGLFMAYTLLRARPEWRDFGRIAAASALGLALPLALTGLAYAAVHGAKPSDYVAFSSAVGFEWRLLPLHWVTLVLDPRPVFPEGLGLAAAFPWIVPGIAGMAVCLTVAPGRAGRPAHCLVAGAALAYLAVYLCYRDLHPTGLWRYNNHHYFKWLMPVFGLYAVLGLAAVLGSARRVRVALVAGVTAISLLCWRVELAARPDKPDKAVAAVLDEHTLRVPSFSGRVDDVVLAGAAGPVEAVYFGKHILTVAGRRFEHFKDFKVFVRPGGLMLMPLRPMPAGEATITFGPGVQLDPAVAPRQERQRVVPSLPFTAPGPPPP